LLPLAVDCGVPEDSKINGHEDRFIGRRGIALERVWITLPGWDTLPDVVVGATIGIEDPGGRVIQA
jgi:hypothetical protein